MYNSIILYHLVYCLFGSVYLCSKSLELINKSLLKNKKIPYKLILINGLTFVISSSVLAYSFSLLKL